MLQNSIKSYLKHGTYDLKSDKAQCMNNDNLEQCAQIIVLLDKC